MKNKMKSSKMLKKADALKGFLGSMAKKKGQDGFIKKDSKEPISFNYTAKYKGDKQILKGTSPEGNYKTKRISEFMSPNIEGRYLGPSTVKETARRTVKGMLKGVEKPVKSSMKKGGSFPDLNKDGQITKADILMGRGVISKPKMQDGGKKKSNPLMTPAISLEERRTLDSSIKNSKVFPPKVKPSGVTKQTKLPMPLANSSSNYKKGQKGMNVMKETKKNATPSIPNSYYAMGGMKEMNPLASMIKKKSMKKAGMKPKMAMGGDFFPQNPLTASKYKGDTLMGQSFKKGGMIKKKKK